jgi:hypothetical protein
MNEAVIREKLDEVCSLLQTSTSLKGASGAVMGQTYKPNQNTTDVHIEESVDHLRLQVKYLLLDLEATKRESSYLRQMLQRRRRRQGGFGGEDGNPSEGDKE